MTSLFFCKDMECQFIHYKENGDPQCLKRKLIFKGNDVFCDFPISAFAFYGFVLSTYHTYNY